jgi:lipopolysaccharide transport system permease protein
LYFKQPVDISAILYFPAGIIVTVLAAAGLGTFLAALNVKYRDFRYAQPFLLQVLFFSSQAIYPLQSIQSELKYLLAINPMNAAIELFRVPLTSIAPDMTIVAIGITSTLFLLIIGLFYFRKTEAYFADLA